MVLKGADYATFMSNINKVYIEVFGTSYSGSIFFDNVVAGSTVINKFDKNVEILSEQTKNLVVAQVIGHGSQTAVKPMAKALSDKIRLQGRTLQLSLASAMSPLTCSICKAIAWPTSTRAHFRRGSIRGAGSREGGCLCGAGEGRASTNSGR